MFNDSSHLNFTLININCKCNSTVLGNFLLCSFPTAVSEMLVQSTVKDIYFLPALPRDKWANGCVKGLKARGGVTINICWKEGDLHEVGLWSKEQNCVKRLHYRGTSVMASIVSGQVHTYNRLLKCVKKSRLEGAFP